MIEAPETRTIPIIDGRASSGWETPEVHWVGMMFFGYRRHLTAAALGSVLALGCSGHSPNFQRGKRAEQRDNWDAAVSHYRLARSKEPENLEYRMALQRALLEAARLHAKQARRLVERGDPAGAIGELELSIHYDPTNRYVREELLAVRQQQQRGQNADAVVERVDAASIFRPGEPVLDPSSSAPLRLSFARGTSLRTVLESLAKLGGINLVFDEGFRDKPIDVELNNVSFRQALDILATTNRFFYKVVRSRTVIVTEDAR